MLEQAEGRMKRIVVFKNQMSHECRAHAVVILNPIPIMGIEFRKE